MSDVNSPEVSVIIPVYNGGSQLRLCLEALRSSCCSDWECIVVDDGSTDSSVQVACNLGARVACTSRPRLGPAIARNLGASLARGDILLFVDADVLVQPDTLGLVAAIMANDPTLAACFGSYDESPGAPNFLSQYKNLMHHYVHQTSHEEASTFWAGCGAIRRDVFLGMGGFSTAYPRPSIEDIELGYRLRAAGQRIRLEKRLQVCHLKRWTPRVLLRTEILDRAIPWARLILERGTLVNDLNLQTGQRYSAIAALLGLLAILVGLYEPWALTVTGLSVASLLTLNRVFYRYLAERRGLWFVVRALPWHWLYYLYSALCFGGVVLWHITFHQQTK